MKCTWKLQFLSLKNLLHFSLLMLNLYIISIDACNLLVFSVSLNFKTMYCSMLVECNIWSVVRYVFCWFVLQYGLFINVLRYYLYKILSKCVCVNILVTDYLLVFWLLRVDCLAKCRVYEVGWLHIWGSPYAR